MRRRIVVDVGNTITVVGVFDDDRLVARWRMATDARASSDEIAWKMAGLAREAGVLDAPIHGCLIGSVVPQLDGALRKGCQRAFDAPVAMVGDSDVKTGLLLRYRHPRELGADRIANAVAARARFGAPVIVVDLGTATTFDIVDAEGAYIGGLILPGLELAARALAEHTARLPQVAPAPTSRCLGQDTQEGIQAGIFWGTVAAIDGLIARIRRELKIERASVVLTGGWAKQLAEAIETPVHCLPELTLEGLWLIAKRRFP